MLFHNGETILEIHVRPALPQDAPAIGEVLCSTDWLTRLIEIPPDELQRWMLHTLDRCLADDSHLVLVAETDRNKILGFVSVHWLPYFLFKGNEGYVSELFVHASARGSGVGTRLVEAVKEEARKRGCHRLMLVNSRERPSYQREFYKKNGWQERESMANFVFELS